MSEGAVAGLLLGFESQQGGIRHSVLLNFLDDIQVTREVWLILITVVAVSAQFQSSISLIMHVSLSA